MLINSFESLLETYNYRVM